LTVGTVAKDSTDATGKTWIVAISGTWVEGDTATVTISNPAAPEFTITLADGVGTATLHTAKTVAALTGVTKADGTPNTADTTKLTLTFDKAVTGLTVANLTVTGATADTLTAGADNKTWTLAIKDLTVAEGGDVTVAIASSPTGFTLSGTQTVTVNKAATPVSLTVTANGDATTATTTLTFTFDKDVTGLEASNITLTGATAGALTGSGKVWTLAVSDITADTVTVAVTGPSGYAVTPSSTDVAVFHPTYTITDVINILRNIVDSTTYPLTDAQKASYDLDKSGAVNIIDAIMVLRLLTA
jgi:hypothetical protein